MNTPSEPANGHIIPTDLLAELAMRELAVLNEEEARAAALSLERQIEEMRKLHEGLASMIELRACDLGEDALCACKAFRDLLASVDHLPVSPATLRMLRSTMLATLSELGVSV